MFKQLSIDKYSVTHAIRKYFAGGTAKEAKMERTAESEQLIALMLRMNDCLRRYKQQADSGKTFMILGSLREYERRRGRPVTVTEIAHASGLALPNVSRLLTPIEQAGFIDRVKNGRTVNVVVTDEGNRRLNDFWNGFSGIIAGALGTLTERQRKDLLESGGKVADYLEQNIKNQSAGDD